MGSIQNQRFAYTMWRSCYAMVYLLKWVPKTFPQFDQNRQFSFAFVAFPQLAFLRKISGDALASNVWECVCECVLYAYKTRDDIPFRDGWLSTVGRQCQCFKFNRDYENRKEKCMRNWMGYAMCNVRRNRMKNKMRNWMRNWLGIWMKNQILNSPHWMGNDMSKTCTGSRQI